MPYATPSGMRRGSAQHVLKAAGAQTATTTGGWVDVGEDARALYVKADVTAAFGTTPTLTVVVECSPDGGTTVIELGTIGANGYRAGPVGTAPTNFTAAATVHAAFPLVGALVRYRSVITGTTPSFTYSVVAEAA